MPSPPPSSAATARSSRSRVGFCDAGVVVVVDRPADAVLAVRRGLVDRRRHGAGELVGLLAGVDRERLDRQARVQLVGSHRFDHGRANAPRRSCK